ncbi:MAG: 2-amino-4-hydroxy-6-hydroxymethyldihydropteridine diphosphokinase [Planctomycetota bacterium]
MEGVLVGFALGGNAPTSEHWVRSAMMSLAHHLDQPRFSTLHTTAPLGPGTAPYQNAVMVGIDRSCRAPREWLGVLQALELAAGRNRVNEVTWGDRPLDIDLLFVGDAIVVTADLIVPHPQMHRRSFVMDPLLELEISWTHPVLRKDVRSLAAGLPA